MFENGYIYALKIYKTIKLNLMTFLSHYNSKIVKQVIVMYRNALKMNRIAIVQSRHLKN